MAFLCLLIVPYGIETRMDAPSHRIQADLLIVPYGIETYVSVRGHKFLVLLIVPYGIETFIRFIIRRQDYLLIVPYGIETASAVACFVWLCPFNRTLWN